MLQFQGQAGKIKLPVEIMEEILAGKKDDDPLLAWMKDAANKKLCFWMKPSMAIS
jgi:hypothetical protein